MRIMQIAAAAALTLAAVPASAQIITGKCTPNDVARRWQAVPLTFDTGSTKIKPEDAKRLDEQASLAKANSIQQICLRGQADRQGDAKSNERLALARANMVADELVRRGVDRKTIVIEAVGEAGGGASIFASAEKSRAERRVDLRFTR